jgi:aspartyl-tRNA(Asn)/glutamyl-tRNA(Gln) amidotransferase subunit A
MTDPLDLGLVELRRAISSGAIASGDVLESSRARIDAWDPSLNAFAEVPAERAPQAGPEPGPLYGIPVAVKDMFVDRDRVPTVGSQVPGHWLRGTATVLTRLRAAGAVVVGYTNLHEWGVDCTSAITATGPIRNPWDLRHIAGGSSGGSSAALACGAVPAAVGSDTGGSIRIPAACCGVVGLKPTWGRVPLDGFVDADSPIDHAGPMGRSVSDVRTLFEILAAARTKPAEVGALRIGFPRSYFFDDLDAGVGDALSGALDTLSKVAGRVVEVDLGTARRSLKAVASIFGTLTYDLLKHDLRERPEGFQPATRALLMAAAHLTPEDRAEGEAIRRRAVREWRELFSQVDVLATPTLSRTPPLVSECLRTLPSGASAETIPYLALNAPMDLAGVPALSLPCAHAGEWSLSLTLSAARGQDDIVLALGEELERALSGDYAHRIAPTARLDRWDPADEADG